MNILRCVGIFSDVYEYSRVCGSIVYMQYTNTLRVGGLFGKQYSVYSVVW